MATKHDTVEPLIALFEEDGFKADEHEPTDRVVTMRSRRGEEIEIDLDNYGVTVVIGASHSYGGSWGSGADLDAAKRSFRSNGGALSKGYAVVEFDPETLFLGINGMGSYSWLGNPPAVGRVSASKRSA